MTNEQFRRFDPTHDSGYCTKLRPARYHKGPLLNDPRQPAVGASGCIYGLLGIAAVLFPTAEVLIYFLFPVKIRTAAIVMGAIAFMSVVERGSNYGGEACHLAGLAFGVWWAMHGDEWWSHSEWALPGSRSKGPPAPPPI